MRLPFLPTLKIAGIVFFATVFSACEKDHMLDCFKGTGSDITEMRTTPAFTRVEIKNNVDVVIYPGHNFKVEITAGKKLIDGITTEVKDGMLLIKNENKCNWVRSFKNKFSARIWLPELKELNAWDAGNVTVADTIRYHTFTFNSYGSSGSIQLLFNTNFIYNNIHTGPADITMKGKAGINFLYHNGNGPVHAEELYTDITYTENKGTNNSFIWAKGLLSAKISYIGNIYYKGVPDSVEVVKNGSGKLIPL